MNKLFHATIFIFATVCYGSLQKERLYQRQGKNNLIIIKQDFSEHFQRTQQVQKEVAQMIKQQVRTIQDSARMLYREHKKNATQIPWQARAQIKEDYFYTDNKVVSILYTVYFDCSINAHPSVWQFAFNYDLISDKQLTLADVFHHDPDYVKNISAACIMQLQNQQKTGVFPDGCTLNFQGVAPQEDHFSIFTLGRDRCTIYCAQYQVAPYPLMPRVHLDL